MSDLISRRAAKDALAKLVPYAICDTSTESYTNGLTDAYNLICQLPSAQPERCEDCVNFSKARLLIPQPEIIRCKDCKFSIPINDDEDGYRCTFHEQYYDNEKRMLWHSGCFCSFGERRSE